MSEKELKEKWFYIQDGIFYNPGQTAEIKTADGLSTRFRIKKAFTVHGFLEHKIVVTLPLTLETLKGLGFISSLKVDKTKC